MGCEAGEEDVLSSSTETPMANFAQINEDGVDINAELRDVDIEDELILDDFEVDQDSEVEIMDFVEEEEEEEAQIFFIVEDMPGFMGKGQDGFRQWIGQNLRYPEIAAENGISGRVFVQFVVEPNGSVTNVKVVRGVDPALDAEAVRVVKSSPKWTPGKQRGKAVRVSFTFPINFVLQ